MKSMKFWLVIATLPLLLVGCSSLFVNFDSDFVSDDQIERASVQAGDITLSYIRAGDKGGKRVIFVHGTPGDAGGNWVQMLHKVPKGYEFIAVDRPGFGLTKPRSTVTSLNAQAAALVPLLETYNGEPVLLVGHSLGGPIVVTAAANYPDKVAGIVVAAGALDPDLEDVLFVQRVGNVPPFSWLLDRTLKNTNRELIDLEDELRQLAPKLSTMNTPIVIVHGTLDDLVPYENVAYMERMFTASPPKVITIEGMNHFLQWKSHDELLKAIKLLSKDTTSDA